MYEREAEKARRKWKGTPCRHNEGTFGGAKRRCALQSDGRTRDFAARQNRNWPRLAQDAQKVHQGRLPGSGGETHRQVRILPLKQ